ncbi:uncharacterized protein LOC134751097 [Cydia strobilella]|uniref:uncharacterized protein LOC134751097 n=1 Tax=Cydia strobilella TaxID=1100964 RepID=UPI003005713B
MFLQQDATELHGDYAKSKMNINRKLQTEYLLNNIIDKEFQSMLLPLGIVPHFFLMSHFKIINNFITPENPASSYIKSLVGSCILVLGHLFRLYRYSDAIKSSGSAIANYVLYFDFIFFSLISIMTHFNSSAQRNNVVELIIKMQHVLNSIKINKVEFLSKQKNQNWHSLFMVFSFYVFHSIFASQYYGFLEFLVNFTIALPMLIFDNHIVTVTRIVVMIKNELLAWNYVMEKNNKEYIATEEEIVNVNVQDSDMFDAYDNVIKSFSLCNKVYQFLVR